MEWINKELEQQQKDERQEHELHTGIVPLWNCVWDCVKHKIAELNATNLPHLGGRFINITEGEDGWRHIYITKLTHPNYYVNAKLDHEQHTIEVQHERVIVKIRKPENEEEFLVEQAIFEIKLSTGQKKTTKV